MLSTRAVLFHEFLGKERKTLPDVDEFYAEHVVARWRQAVAGGDEELFRKRLAWDGWPQGPDLIRQLALGLFGDNNDQEFQLLHQSVSLGHDLPTAAESLGAWVGRQVAQRWPRSWRFAHLAHLQEACSQQLGGLLQLAAGEPSISAGNLFHQRPIVARWVSQRAREWVRTAVRLAWRFCRDREQLALAFRWFSVKLTPSVCRWGCSDWHKGESVVALEFAPLPTVFYKPRSLQPELVLQKWFELFRDLGVRVTSLPPMLARGGYGWVQEVSRAELASSDDIRARFCSAGALLAVAWVLGIRDLHWENVVADANGPVIVDGEIWAQPVPSSEQKPKEAVLASGLLTLPAFKDGVVHDDGALLGGSHTRVKSLPFGVASAQIRSTSVMSLWVAFRRAWSGSGERARWQVLPPRVGPPWKG